MQMRAYSSSRWAVQAGGAGGQRVVGSSGRAQVGSKWAGRTVGWGGPCGGWAGRPVYLQASFM